MLKWAWLRPSPGRYLSAIRDSRRCDVRACRQKMAVGGHRQRGVALVLTQPAPFIPVALPAMSHLQYITEGSDMTIAASRQAFAFTLAVGFGLISGGSQSGFAGPVTLVKDQGPTHARCDHTTPDQTSWLSCVGKPSQTASSAELFYAGYWLAKSGSYKKALLYLMAADQTDPRVVTYIGFSLRKLGKVSDALPYYDKALALNPNYNVARAYLGEAHLTTGNVVGAERELGEIAQRCGIHCAEHIDLAGHIAAYKMAHRNKG